MKNDLPRKTMLKAKNVPKPNPKLAKNKKPDLSRIDSTKIAPGDDVVFNMPIPGFSVQLPLNMEIRIIRAKKPGPRLLITAVVHGDEIIGVEIIHQLLNTGVLDNLVRGDVVLIPIMNIAGFINHTRYLPDGRDLNRCFPGAEKGSLTSRLAHFITNNILNRCTHAIDLHAGAKNHFNLPQIRVDIKNKKALEMAKAFKAPLILNAPLRPGSMREVATNNNMPMLLFEGSEAGRFDAETAHAACNGIINVLEYLKMIKPVKREGVYKKHKQKIATESHWMRAPESGIFYPLKGRGETVKNGEVLGYVSDPLQQKRTEVTATCRGMIIGHNLIPVVHEGDALFNIACL